MAAFASPRVSVDCDRSLLHYRPPSAAAAAAAGVAVGDAGDAATAPETRETRGHGSSPTV